jgi:hypothetical protein
MIWRGPHPPVYLGEQAAPEKKDSRALYPIELE